MTTSNKNLNSYPPNVYHTPTVQANNVEDEFYHNLTKGGAVRRIINLSKKNHDFLYDRDLDQCLSYDGTRWAYNNHTLHTRVTKLIEQDLPHERDTFHDPKKRAALFKFIMKWDDIGCDPIARELKKNSEVSKDTSFFNSNGDLINCINGTFNLVTMTLQPHNPLDYITTIVQANYDPDAKGKLWDSFILDLCKGDPEFVIWLEETLAASFYSTWNKDKFFICQGPADTSKTVLFQVMQKLFGKDLVTSIQGDSIEKGRQRFQVEQIFAKLEAHKIVYLTESSYEATLNDEFIKVISAHKEIRVKEKFVKPWYYNPEFTMFYVCNSMPKFKTAETLRNILISVPFHNIVSKANQDPDLIDKLLEERDYIFTRLMNRIKARHDRGGVPAPTPQAVKRSTAVFWEELADPLIFFMNSNFTIEVTPITPLGDRLTLKEVRGEFNKYLLNNVSDKPISTGQFAKKLKLMGFTEGGGEILYGEKGYVFKYLKRTIWTSEEEDYS